MSAYGQLEEKFQRLLAVRDAEAMLHWDLSAMMPKGGAAARAEQLAALKAVQHGMISAPELPDLLSEAEGDGAL
ncbi:MAG: carboxypeptidase M32, partial [Rhodospirillales bacterium]|nr:carboxypeptidase M32 [Rhodospirillales bacterium]